MNVDTPSYTRRFDQSNQRIVTRLKSVERTSLPKGMATLLPADAAVRRQLERVALNVFESWGYEEIIPPIFEYLDVIGPGLGPGLVEKAYTVSDRSSGRVMLLRPDVTPQIARMAGTILRDAPKPLRLCYGANVFRYEDEHAGHERETFQLGAELIGPVDSSADAEVLALAVDVLTRLGTRDITAAVGHVGFFQGWLGEINVSPDRALLIEDAVAKKDRSMLVALLCGDGYSHSDAVRQAGILDLIGPESVLKRADDLVRSAASRAAVEMLREVASHACDYGIGNALLFDLAEIRGREYYSGLIFELFGGGVGYEVGRGGRYDSLIGRFGSPVPSTGFAIHLERLQQGLDKFDGASPFTPLDALVLAAGRVREAIQLAGRLRRAGVRVAVWSEAEAEAEDYAQRRSIAWIVSPGSARNRYDVWSASDRRVKRMTETACVAAISTRRPGRGRRGS